MSTQSCVHPKTGQTYKCFGRLNSSLYVYSVYQPCAWQNKVELVFIAIKQAQALPFQLALEKICNDSFVLFFTVVCKYLGSPGHEILRVAINGPAILIWGARQLSALHDGLRKEPKKQPKLWLPYALLAPKSMISFRSQRSRRCCRPLAPTFVGQQRLRQMFSTLHTYSKHLRVQ